MEMREFKKTKTCVFLAISIAVLGIFPIFCQALSNRTEIQNQVDVSANTGGNVSNGGQTTEGSSRNSIQTQTVINGKTVDSTNINSTGSASSSSSIKIEIRTENGSTTIYKETEINGEKKTENRQIEPDNATTEENSGINSQAEPAQTAKTNFRKNMADIRNFIATLFFDFKSIFQYIFKF